MGREMCDLVMSEAHTQHGSTKGMGNTPEAETDTLKLNQTSAQHKAQIEAH